MGERCRPAASQPALRPPLLRIPLDAGAAVTRAAMLVGEAAARAAAVGRVPSLAEEEAEKAKEAVRSQSETRSSPTLNLNVNQVAEQWGRSRRAQLARVLAETYLRSSQSDRLGGNAMESCASPSCGDTHTLYCYQKF